MLGKFGLCLCVEGLYGNDAAFCPALSLMLFPIPLQPSPILIPVWLRRIPGAWS